LFNGSGQTRCRCGRGRDRERSGYLVRWQHHASIDAGVIEGTPNVEADKLAAARKRIAALETELALIRDARGLFNEQAAVPPKCRRDR
jgi:hypothetical protein